MWIPIVLAGGVVALVFLLKPGGVSAAQYQPPAPGPLVQPGQPSPARARAYMNRLDVALMAFMSASIIPGGAVPALPVLLGTLDVVGGMANLDVVKGQITQSDFAAITDKIAAIRKQIGK